MNTCLLAFFGMPGHIELLIFCFLALLLFGHRLPSVMRSLGQGVVEFKKGVKGIEDDLKDEDGEDSKSQGSRKQVESASHEG